MILYILQTTQLRTFIVLGHHICDSLAHITNSPDDI